MKNLIAPSKALGYSSLYIDFLAGAESARYFFPSQASASVALDLDRLSYDRDCLADILENQNKTYKAQQTAFDNIEKLRKNRTLCIFTGQQTCLAGGPLLIVFKAVGIIKTAELLSKQLDRDVIPIFWLAGDDHDFEEANHVWLLNKDMEPVKISYNMRPDWELPMSEIGFSSEDELDRVKRKIKDTLGETDFSSDLYDLLDNCYTGRDTFVTAFGKMLAVLFSGKGLILFSPGDADAKKHSIPFFRTIIKRRAEIKDILEQTNREIVANGYRLQVEKNEKSCHLFYNLNGRKPILYEDGKFKVGDDAFTEAEIIERIESFPEKFSPDVITRPVFQSYLFPAVAQKCGPAEIAYLAQVNPLFGFFNLVPPCHTSRPTATLLEPRFAGMIDEYRISFEELTDDIELLVNRILRESFPDDLETKFKDFRRGIDEKFSCFIDESLNFDQGLSRFGRQTYGKVDFALKNFESKVFLTHKKKSGATRSRIYKLYNTIMTNRALQERSLNICYFISRYGLKVIDAIYSRLDCVETGHQIITLTESGD